VLATTRKQPIRSWIADETGIRYKDRHSVGVARRYRGQLGKQENCQMAVTLSVVARQASLPVTQRLYLRGWEPRHLPKSQVGNKGVKFQPKPRSPRPSGDRPLEGRKRLAGEP